MTVSELVSRFPEIPGDLHCEVVLETFAETFDGYLATAAKPSACSSDWTPENCAYMKLVGPVDIYRYGLSDRDKVVGQLQTLVSEYEASTDAFEASMFAGNTK